MKKEMDSSPKSEIILYQPNETVSLEVRLDEETVWLSQQQIAELFGVNQLAISKHIANIYKSGELEEHSTYSILEYMGNEGNQVYKTKFYNLDMILSVGYRVNSRNATLFRQWANKVLKEYLLRGYSINQHFERLEQRVTQTENKIDFFVRTSLPPVEDFHDRFLIIDDVVYHFGASFKDLGNRLFAFNKMGLDKDFILSAVKSKVKKS